MHGYLQRLTGNPICIIRVGATAVSYGVGSFEFAAVADVHGQEAIIRALQADHPKCEACEWYQRLKMSHANKAFDLIHRELNVKPTWERYP